MPGGRPRKNNATDARQPDPTAANVGYEARLWQMADALRGSMDAAEYKHVVLGLIFLKYVSDAFEERHAKLEAERAQGADPEDPDEYRAANIFWVPKEARWSQLKGNAPQPTVAKLVDDAMEAVERDNPSLKDPARPSTSSASGASSTLSATSGSATRRAGRRTCSGASTSTSSRSSRGPKARRAASSIPRAW
jgi:type I restriction enzyme M protein